MAPMPEQEDILRNRVFPELLKYSLPDSRFDNDLYRFVPDFRDSSLAIARVVELPQYQSAATILVTPDNSLEQLRLRALKDGKKVVVATHGMHRGFVLLDPRRVGEERYEAASWLDGMERPGIGRHLTLVQMQEERINIELFITGALAISDNGVMIRDSPHSVDLQWLMMKERNLLAPSAHVICMVHGSQAIQGQFEQVEQDAVACDIIITPEKTIHVPTACKPDKATCEKKFDALDPKIFDGIPPLQELKGIRMMEKIMNNAGFAAEQKPPAVIQNTAEEQMGIDMVERLMRGYRA